MWRKIHKVFAETPIQESLFFHNDDLVGFFNSIPQGRLLAMVEAMLCEFQSKHPAPCVMVDVHGSIKTSAVHLGFSKQSSHANFKRLWLEHLVPLVQLSFECGRFTAVGNTYRQIRGTCMGNQISPILSKIAVVAVEVAWSRAWSSHFVGHRIFVDFSLLAICRQQGFIDVAIEQSTQCSSILFAFGFLRTSCST